MLNKISCYSKTGNFIWLRSNSCFFNFFSTFRWWTIVIRWDLIDVPQDNIKVRYKSIEE